MVAIHISLSTQTLKKAEVKINQKMQYEQAKIQSEREYKELVNKHNRELYGWRNILRMFADRNVSRIEEEEANKSYETMARILDKNRQNDLFMQEKLEKLVEVMSTVVYAREITVLFLF